MGMITFPRGGVLLGGQHLDRVVEEVVVLHSYASPPQRCVRLVTV